MLLGLSSVPLFSYLFIIHFLSYLVIESCCLLQSSPKPLMQGSGFGNVGSAPGGGGPGSGPPSQADANAMVSRLCALSGSCLSALFSDFQGPYVCPNLLFFCVLSVEPFFVALFIWREMNSFSLPRLKI